MRKSEICFNTGAHSSSVARHWSLPHRDGLISLLSLSRNSYIFAASFVDTEVNFFASSISNFSSMVVNP